MAKVLPLVLVVVVVGHGARLCTRACARVPHGPWRQPEARHRASRNPPAGRARRAARELGARRGETTPSAATRGKFLKSKPGGNRPGSAAPAKSNCRNQKESSMSSSRRVASRRVALRSIRYVSHTSHTYVMCHTSSTTAHVNFHKSLVT